MKVAHLCLVSSLFLAQTGFSYSNEELEQIDKLPKSVELDVELEFQGDFSRETAKVKMGYFSRNWFNWLDGSLLTIGYRGCEMQPTEMDQTLGCTLSKVALRKFSRSSPRRGGKEFNLYVTFEPEEGETFGYSCEIDFNYQDLKITPRGANIFKKNRAEIKLVYDRDAYKCSVVSQFDPNAAL